MYRITTLCRVSRPETLAVVKQNEMPTRMENIDIQRSSRQSITLRVRNHTTNAGNRIKDKRVPTEMHAKYLK